MQYKGSPLQRHPKDAIKPGPSLHLCVPSGSEEKEEDSWHYRLLMRLMIALRSTLCRKMEFPV
ncbi:hypothetical protein JZ751_020646 [Albula glossodonta]|uniref:Uncharacterized protein n=1 Tax=Albula glossodonta TaxID=121402 RepID=A0A8T2PFX3_9TELE|nr:hypothetical protein JZ751_020646 [Albula glossodonta]